MTLRDVALKIAWAYLGTPYIWGGDDPDGFDCSGLIVEILKSAGLLERGSDLTAHELWHMFQTDDVDGPYEGCLVFWWNKTKTRIRHVEMCVSRHLAIGASGGGSRTLTRKDAMKQNAFIKVRPINSRAGVAGYVDPFNG